MFTSSEQILPPSLVSKILPLVKLVFRSARTFVTAVAFSLGTLRCHDGDDNETVKKATRWIGKTTTMHVYHSFLYISSPSLHDYDDGGRKQTTVKFSFSSWTWIGFLGIGSKTVRLHLTKYMSWSNRDRDWKNANSLFKRRFRGRRHRGISNSIFLNPSNVTFRSPKKLFWSKAKKVVSKGKKEGKLSKAKKTRDWCFHWSRGCCNQLVLRLTGAWLIFVTDGAKDHVAIFLTT